MNELLDTLAESFPELPLMVLTPLADGGDRLVARVAGQRGIPFVAVLPMQQSVYETDFDDPGSLQEFRDLLQQADRIIELPAVEGPDASRDMQYAQVGVYISNHSQLMLALWDGKEDGAFGGTSQVVNYHLTALMDGFASDPTPANLLVEKENDLVFHVACSRDREEGAVASGLQPLQCRWLTGRDYVPTGSEMPSEHRVMFSRMESFLKDWHKLGPGSLPYDNSLLQETADLELPSAVGVMDRLFKASDALAIHFQRRFHHGIRVLYSMAVFMGLIFLVYTEFDANRYTVLLFLALFFVAIGIHWLGDRFEWHRRYLDYRALAEGLRVQFYWNLSGVVDHSTADFAFDNFLQSQDSELGWIRHVMRNASLARTRGEKPNDGWVPWVIDQWVGEPGGETGQLGWYLRKERLNAMKYQRTRRLASICLWLSIVVAVSMFLMGNISSPWSETLEPWLLMLMGSLPLIVGIRDAYSHKLAEKELLKQYGFMQSVFGKAQRLLGRDTDLAWRRDVLLALGQASLEEGAEWLIMHRERPLEHGGLQSV